MNTIESSGILGLIAMVILTVNIVMGIMLSTNYKQSTYWQRLSPKIKAFKIINTN